MKPSRRIVFTLAAALVLTLAAHTHADMPEGKLTQDLIVGANHDVPLKKDQVVQLLSQHPDKTVITVPLPDGSNGIFQVDTILIKPVPAGTPLGVPAPPPPPPPPPGTVPPSYPAAFAGPATFQTTLGNHTGGEAALIKLDSGDQAYLASSRQLLGFQGGFQDQLAAKDVPNVVQRIQLAPFTGSGATYDVTGLLVKTSRLKPAGGKPLDDLALYRLHDSTAQPAALALAAQPPAVGDIVWVIARLRNSPPDQVAHRAQVLAIKDWLEIQFDDDGTILAGSIGAPVLNITGQVVGVLSYGLSGGGHIRGYVIPAALLAKTAQGG